MSKRCPYCAEEIQSDAVKCKHCHSWVETHGRSEKGFWSRQITRPKNDRMIAGVCSAFGRFLHVDPTIVRVVFVLLMCFTAFVPGLVAYLILMFVIPIESGHSTMSG